MTVVAAPYVRAIPVYAVPPKILVQFRMFRDGEVTSSRKIVRIYRDWDSVQKLDLVFEAEQGELSRALQLDLATLLAQDVWLVAGLDVYPPKRTRMVYMTIASAGVYTFNITEPFDRHTLGGNGLLSGSFPLNMVTQGGNLPSQAEIRTLYRPNTGDPGDGILVATTTCNADGTWQVSGLDENSKFDIVARIPGFNDVIISNVQPVVAPPAG